ncbi:MULTISPECIES: cellulase family glycosylhydrolase [unclassified Carboxylicivirga]|uniref:cellulase family glycosylhydrolase n=1 Tax=Carboxylicivirga TaxID=1628153 RepID=UPI003D352491
MFRINKIGRKGLFFIPLLSVFLLQGCLTHENGKGGDAITPSTITVKGQRFVDNNGRHVILNGINVVNKSKKDQYLFGGGAEFYANLKSWGFNSIRFYINWDGLELEPGVYNESYLKEIDKRIQWAADNGVFVILDMHQDLFGLKFSNGAPEWATLDEGKPHITGDVWSDAYMMSEAVQTAFDNFWANKPASDGIGVQDHYANLWKHIAKRYADNPTVIGYDIMNEPFAGSSALQAMPAMLTAYGELIYATTGKVLTEEELVAIWGDVNRRTEALKVLSTKENYSYVIDALYDVNAGFEKNHLQAMYQKVANAIREVDTTHVLFLEHSYFSNVGVKSSIERVRLKDGSPDMLVAYAPHGYDLVTDTDDASSSNSERVEFIYNRIKEKGEQMEMPVWVGEWGAYYSHGEGIVSVARTAIRLIESHLFGNAYWSYNSGTENLAYFKKAILRPYPAYTCGELLQYHYSHATGELNVEWHEATNISAPTTIFVPWLSSLKMDELPESVEVVKGKGSDAGWVTIKPTGKGGKRSQILSFKKMY